MALDPGFANARTTIICNAVGKRIDSELRRKRLESPEGQKDARRRAREKKLYKEQRGLRRRRA